MHRFPTTKLRAPRSAADVLDRPRPEALLDAARASLRATLLLAPAGYGKTTLVAAWSRRQDPAPAWFTVDAGDDPGADADAAAARVTSWLRAALQGAGFEEDAFGDARDTEEHAPADPSALAAAVEAGAWRGVVVIDDVHHLGRDAGAALATWVERAPEGVHTLLLARRSPPLPVARWLARGEIELLGVDALRLDPAEGRALAGRLVPALSRDHADALVARVEGWPAGVQLAARTLRGKADPADVIERFTGTDRYVLAFLTEEVLLRLPDDLHEAAVMLAGPPRLCAALVDAVTLRDDGAALLARLEVGEAFLERLDAQDDDGPWFRFPDFFRDLLAHRLMLTHPDLPAQLAEREATWWAARSARSTPPSPLRAEAAVGDGDPDALTERERQVVVLLAAGGTTKSIARELGLSPNTVKTHTRHVFEKLGARNRTEAAAAARRRGLL